MSSLLEELHDIEGIDPVGLWPLGIAWWAVLALALLVVIMLAWIAIRRRAFNRSWRRETLERINALEKNLTEATSREAAIALSETLRRIAVHRYSREECAGLAGDTWLKWLASRDPKGFDWMGKGKILVDAPYASPQKALSTGQVEELIQAVKRWVR